MLKLEIWPSFINKSTFELKKSPEGWELIFCKEAYDFMKDPGGFWKANTVDTSIADKVFELACDIVDREIPRTSFGLDGVTSRILLSREGKETEKNFWSPDEGSREYRFMELVFQLIDEGIKDPICVNYMELLDQYFFDSFPAKEFDEDPYRLKIIGGITSNEMEVLDKKMIELKSKPKGILDMSNFLTTGWALNDTFLQVQDSQHIEIWVNQASFNYLTQIGYSPVRLTKK
ncbi:MAG: hypothetical protein MI810_18305 [Flavobacteriales bacterium]|nr:hypothetical protein [Flavobacteriales bacterium]